MILKKDKRLASKKIDGNYFLVSPWDHKLHKCNQTASFIVDLIDKGCPRSEIEQALCNEFDVDAETAAKDTSDFVKKIQDLKIYTV